MRAARLLVGTAMVVVLGSACGEDDVGVLSSGVSTTAPDHHAGGHEEGLAFGEPADAADADRVVDVDMSDEMRFSPDQIAVAPGETITFRLHNRGKVDHDFTLGDAATQESHDMAMTRGASAAMGHDGGNGIVVAPGQTAELTWHFTSVADVLFGCHIPGHYAAGMRGALVEG